MAPVLAFGGLCFYLALLDRRRQPEPVGMDEVKDAVLAILVERASMVVC